MDIVHKLSKQIPRRWVVVIKYVKQYCYRVVKGRKRIETNHNYKKLSKKDTHVFFGYYDVSPFNIFTDEIVYCSLKTKENKLHILLSSLSDNSETEIAESRAWNWQQGCRLRWMPGNNREVVFNDFDGKSYFARVLNIDNRTERRIDAPLYDISPDGCYGLTIDFERLGVKRPGYGYTCRNYEEHTHNLQEECIEIVDLKANTRKSVLTYNEISAILGNKSNDFSNNYINHICFSPSGDKFLFFWLSDEINALKAFLLVYDFCTKKTSVLETQEKVSHYVWEDEDNIICTACDNKLKEHYYRYNVSTGTKQVLNSLCLNQDGHPSIFDKEHILTDTYPNLMGYQRLYLANIDKGGYTDILNIYSDCCIEGEMRTDLHPRLNHEKTIVCFDANVSGYRELYFLDIQK